MSRVAWIIIPVYHVSSGTGRYSEFHLLEDPALQVNEQHPITIAGFQGGGSQILSVSYKGPGIGKQPVPASAFWRPATDP